MNSEGCRSFKNKPQERAQKVYFTHKDIDVWEDEYLDLLIRRLFREWLAKIGVPSKFQIDVFRGFQKGFHLKRDKEVNMWQNNWYLLYDMQNEHRLDLIREADLSRLLQTSRLFLPKKPALYKRFLFWIGRLMQKIGTSLIKRFEPVSNDHTASTTTA